MLILVAGLALFLGVHSLQVVPGLRTRLRTGLGATTYKLIYTVLSLVGLGLLIYGKIIAHPPVAIWAPPEWSRHLAFLVVPLSLILLVSAYAPGHIRRIVRHPMLASVVLWSGAHFLANGELSAMLLFGGFFVWSSITYISACLRETPPPVVKGWGGDLTAIVLGALLALIIINVHMYLFGVAIIG
ncbi:NnrU family protein [uncultured Maricaulis sp.]|uniref:NnrU family protein n=1 Tax=uncultured Maricaulis sp. TaxID=174710 RepID=UPI0030DD7FD9|tara:strand:+ start:22420 stop:22977 length:558 start_codon:yes stop_codon:yes gene_type:complete